MVVYRDAAGRRAGGFDDRGTWTVVLTDGQRLPLRAIRSVGQTDANGIVISAWEVRAHGYDGLK